MSVQSFDYSLNLLVSGHISSANQIPRSFQSNEEVTKKLPVNQQHCIYSVVIFYNVMDDDTVIFYG